MVANSIDNCVCLAAVSLKRVANFLGLTILRPLAGVWMSLRYPLGERELGQTKSVCGPSARIVLVICAAEIITGISERGLGYI